MLPPPPMWHRDRRQLMHETCWGVFGVFLCLSLVVGCHRYVAPKGVPTHPAVGMSALEHAERNQSHVVARATIGGVTYSEPKK